MLFRLGRLDWIGLDWVGLGSSRNISDMMIFPQELREYNWRQSSMANPPSFADLDSRWERNVRKFEDKWRASEMI